jgi:hypothetical protein
VHTLLSLQFGGDPPTHAPPAQASLVVQRLPSSQVLPFAFAGFEHIPVPGLQTPASWHWSCAVQTTGVWTQPVSVLQLSIVQRSVSWQSTGGNTHPLAGLQLFSVHALLSSQVMAG